MRHLRAALALALFTGAPLVAQVPSGIISIGRTDSIWSPTLKEWRRYQTYTPPGYAESPYLPRAYPVLYVLDGPAHFPFVTGLVHFLSQTGWIPELIVVAVANTDRTRDLTPSHSIVAPTGKPDTSMATSGGGDAFLSFLRSELIPHVESSFRVEPYRILVGSSLGGLTAIRALYTMPDVFNAYVAIDPSLWWDRRLLINEAPQRLPQLRGKGRTLVIAQANTVDLASNSPEGPCGTPTPRSPCADSSKTNHFRAIREFHRVVQRTAVPDLRYTFRYYPHDDHGSVSLIAEYDALRFIFDGYKIDFDAQPTPAAVLAQFALVSRRLGYQVQPSEKLFALATRYLDDVYDDLFWAVSMARLYADVYPKSPRAHEALGMALSVVGDTLGALAALERGLAIDPANARIKELQQRLRPKAR